MRASGWEVIDVANASYDVEAIVAALRFAKFSRGKPVFIHCCTVIGVDTTTAGTYKAHHGTFDRTSIARLKRLAGLPEESTHVVPNEPLQFFRERKTYGEELENKWNALRSQYETACPQKAAELQSRIDGSQGPWLEILDSAKACEFEGLATREVNGNLLEKLWAANPALCGGGADLVNSNKISYSMTDVFHPMQVELFLDLLFGPF